MEDPFFLLLERMRRILEGGGRVALWEERDGGAAAAAAKSLQFCPTLCDPIDGSPPGSPVPGFSRRGHWSGLPFPSPVHEREN